MPQKKTESKPCRNTTASTRKPAAKSKKKQQKGNHTKRIWIWIVLVVILIALGGFVAKFMLSTAPEDTIILVPRECTNEMLADSLRKHLGDECSADVLLLLKLSGTKAQDITGAYEVKFGNSALGIALRLARHRQSEIKLNIKHLRTHDDLVNLIASKTGNTADEVNKVLNDTALLNKYNVDDQLVRVLFMEDSYNVYYGWTAQHVVDKITKSYDSFWDETRRNKAKALGLTPQEVMIVASIVDEESNMSDEKGKIGRLYINRLHKNMKLQADPTAKYAVGDFSLRRITGKQTSVDNRYNTYKYAGLPPGPIRTTSRTTVDAILNSQPSNHLFMCAKEDFSGYHNFADTYEEHKENARRYQAELNRRNIH